MKLSPRAEGALWRRLHGRELSALARVRSEGPAKARHRAAVGVVALGFALAGCTASSSPSSGSHDLLHLNDNAPIDGGIGKRELTSQEKKVIADAVGLSVRDPGSAKYRWTKIANGDGSINYCATVDAKSPYNAYNGRQAFIVETTVVGGKVSSAVVGLIAGGKDAAIVSKMCAKYGLNPDDAS